MSLYQDHEGKHRGVTVTVAERPHPTDEKLAEMADFLRRAKASRVRVAAQRVIAIAMELAEDGLSAEEIREGMLDMASTGADRAAEYIAAYDRKQDELMADRRDFAAEYARNDGEDTP